MNPLHKSQLKLVSNRPEAHLTPGADLEREIRSREFCFGQSNQLIEAALLRDPEVRSLLTAERAAQLAPRVAETADATAPMARTAMEDTVEQLDVRDINQAEARTKLSEIYPGDAPAAGDVTPIRPTAPEQPHEDWPEAA